MAAELGVSLSTARRLVKSGPPGSWDEPRLVRFAEELYARAHRTAVARPPEVKAVLEQRRRAPVYADAARVAAADGLRRALLDLDRRRLCEPKDWSPRAALAEELGISSERLGRWLKAGHVHQDAMERVSGWLQQRVERDIRRMAEQGHVEALIEQAKVPAYAHTLGGQAPPPGAPRKFAARAPDIQSREGLTQSVDHSGYYWDLRVEAWSTFERIEQWCAWALNHRRAPGMIVGPFWIVTALCTIYHPHGRRKGKTKSPGGVRQFERKTDRERGNNLSLNEPVSSGMVSRGGLERAVKLFREAMTIEHCEYDQIYVHAVLVRNWRHRTPTERHNYRTRLTAKHNNATALRELAKEAAASKAREAAKKKALRRRVRDEAKASLGPRPIPQRKKKRS